MTGLPKTGDVIRFSVLPIGSYATVGEAYRVNHLGGKHSVSLRRVDDTSGTFDPPSTYRTAVWERVA